MEQVSAGYYRSIRFTNGTERMEWWSSEATERDDSLVLVATAQISLKGLANPKSANEAGSKETINLALVCLCVLELLQSKSQRCSLPLKKK